MWFMMSSAQDLTDKPYLDRYGVEVKVHPLDAGTNHQRRRESRRAVVADDQELILVQFSAQREHFWWNIWGGSMQEQLRSS
jgi:hypothetical protein